ncbi:MAG: adenosylmethionine--8-amino-7-oxononanoate transaminase [Spirochaetes bacterium GWF1_41_5]|nr:MAG: adenosylmethionine--8-amino-7-oxononanoate transaminase [Spirochaetes bacterium GWF1_41_5]
MSKKQKIRELDKKFIWHPFTQMKDYEKNGHIVIERARKFQLFDDQENSYYDTISSWWTNLFGHGEKKIINAVKKQLGKLEHVNFSGFTHPPAAELVSKLYSLLPQPLCRFFFSDNGSTAVEAALKIAFQYWHNRGQKQKNCFIMLKNAYHGDTLGAVSTGGLDYHRLFQPLLFKTFMAEPPDCSKCRFRKSAYTFDSLQNGCSLECFNSIEEIIKKHHHEAAAVIIEPLLQCAGGMKVYPPAYINRLSKLARKFQVLVIFDEVATGFGRTGSLFALEQTETVPDLICLSKGITGGFLPLALTVCTEDIYQAFYGNFSENKTFFHGHSYTANPLACSAALAAVKLLREKKLPQSRKKQMLFFQEEVRQFAKYDFISDIRYLGFVGAIDLAAEKNRPFPAEKRIGFRIYRKSLANGLVLRPLGDTIYWFLPITIGCRDLKKIMKKTEKTLLEVMQEIRHE